MKIAIGADHRGYELKEHIKNVLILPNEDIEWIDVGTYNKERSDFPVFTHKVVEKIKKNNVHHGILICGSGIGMSIAANRISGIYAALVWNEIVAQKSKEHNNANILVLPSDFIADQEAVSMILAWLTATFNGGRYQERINQIEEYLNKSY